MTLKPKTNVTRYTNISRFVFYSACIAGILAWLDSQIITAWGLEWKLLDITGTLLIAYATIVLAISWITPGVLVIFGVPWLAQGWLRGINPITISKAPWEELSTAKRFRIYIWSILLSGFTLLTIIGLIIQSIRK